MRSDENLYERLDEIASEIKILPQSKLESISKKVDELSGEERDEFERFFSDVLNDKKSYDAVGAKYSDPSSIDTLRLKALAYKELKRFH